MRGRLILVLLALCARSARAQHEGHNMAGMNMNDSSSLTNHFMLQAIPIVTQANPSAGGLSRTQAVLTQTLLMTRTNWRALSFDATFNAEGFTMPRGELNTGAYGEGFIDKRHPHTYLHELMLSGVRHAGAAELSASAGRGFATFGTDDPMMRPLVKYPVNHHLSQILERAVAAGALRVGKVILEGSTFGGDEPSHPSSLPKLSRFGDSWAVRGTVLPHRGVELQTSYARVASPEQESGAGLDQRKQSASARAGIGNWYALVEWSRTRERDHSRNLNVFQYSSALAEALATHGAISVAARLEQTERPEEEREADPFRTPRPPSDLSLGGITRWRIATIHLNAGSVTRWRLSGVPFAEVARLNAVPRNAGALLRPEVLYGTSNFWMVTLGVRVRAGMDHDRMGRYGVANQ